MNKRSKIIVSDYNPNWAVEFGKLKNVLNAYLKSAIINIEHVGSTSIIGLKAKPILDIDIIITSDELLLQKVIDRLSKLGYKHVGNLGITGREAFKRLNSKTPDFGTNKEWFKHNLYLCKEGSIGLMNHINFRNYLRDNPDEIEQYSQLKLELVEKHPYDIDSYIDGKTDFIIDILNKAGMKESDTKLINSENKLK